MAGPVLVELAAGDPPAAWQSLGFTVDDSRLRVGAATLRLGAEGNGLVSWTLAGEGAGDVDGVPTTWVEPGAADTAAGRQEHPNGALLIDHVVLATPDLERTLGALGAVGFDLRRTREAGTPQQPMRQAFFRMGEVILEVVGPPEPAGDGPASLWGLVVVVGDLEACAAQLGEHLGTPRAAVQPGRRIATVRRAGGVGVRLALMTPDMVGR